MAMNDVFAAMVHDVLFDVRRHCDSILGVALTLPNTTSQSGRTLAAAIVRQQVADVFQLHLLSSNANSTYIGIIPEGVAAARDLCETALGQQKGPVRVMTVDAGRSRITVRCQITALAGPTPRCSEAQMQYVQPPGCCVTSLV